MYLRIAISVGMLALAGCSVAQHAPKPGESDLRKAFLHHQALEFPEVKATYPQSGGEGFVLSERWKNYQKYAKKCPAIAEVERVSIGKDNKGNYVISLHGPDSGIDKDGFDTGVCSLWMVGAGEDKQLEVRDFTSY